MFERYSEKARRAIFFARYEASQIGGSYIEAEHLLLGLLREDRSGRSFFLPPGEAETIRKEVQAHKPFGKPVSTSVDMPLSEECAHILTFAAGEANNLNHRHVEPEHLLLGILREEKCFAARLLQARGVEILELRSKIAERLDLRKEETPRPVMAVARIDVRDVIAMVLRVWRTGDAEKISNCFHEHGQLWDTQRKLWIGRTEIQEGVRLYFSSRGGDPGEENTGDLRFAGQNTAVVTVVWKPKAETENPKSRHPQMTLVMSQTANGWHVLSASLEDAP